MSECANCGEPGHPGHHWLVMDVCDDEGNIKKGVYVCYHDPRADPLHPQYDPSFVIEDALPPEEYR